MGIQCRIIRDKEGKVSYVEAPNGNRSKLYDEAIEKVGQESALDIVLTAYTPSFTEEVKNPKRDAFRRQLINRINTLPTSVETVSLNLEGIDYNLDLSTLEMTTEDLGNGETLMSFTAEMNTPESKSNLNARQSAEVRTPEFMAWSNNWNDVIKDENGEPQVHYHGTAEDRFTEFNSGIGLEFFSPTRAVANGYKGFNSDENGMYEVYLKSPKTLDVSKEVPSEVEAFMKTNRAKINKYLKEEGMDDLSYDPMTTESIAFKKQEGKAWKDIAPFKRLMHMMTKNKYNWQILEYPPFVEFLKEQGYTALRTLENDGNIGMFYGNSIKSAQENVGTFSNETVDIRYSKIKGDNAPVDMVRNLVSKLRKSGLAKNVYILPEAQLQETLEKGGYARQSGARGFALGDAVYLNSDNIGLDTAIHEFSHLWNSWMKENAPEIYNQGIQLMKDAGENNPYIQQVKKTQPKLTGEALYEEALAQAIGDNGKLIVESKEGKTLKDWLTKLWKFISGKVGLADTTVEDFRKLTLDQFAEKAAIDLLSGESIEDLMNSETGTVGATFDIRPDAVMEAITPRDEFGYNVDFVTPVEKRTLSEVIEEYEGRVLVITSDATGTGYDSNGDPIYGGVGYSMITENIDGKVGFASLSAGTAKTTMRKMENQYGKGKKVAVFVMVQNPSATMGNYYGAKYFARGLKAIKAEDPAMFDLVVEDFKKYLNNATVNKEFKQRAREVLGGTVNSTEAANRGEQIKQELIELIRNVDKYTPTDFSQEFIKDTTFNARTSILKGLISEKADTGSDKWLTVVALRERGFNRLEFLKEYGDNTLFTEEMYEQDRGGFIASGFEFETPQTEEEFQTLLNDTQNSGLTHPQFNGKVPATGKRWILDGMYDVNDVFMKHAKPYSGINYEYISEEQVAKTVQEMYPEDINYLKEFVKKGAKYVAPENRTYSNLKSTKKIEFKSRLGEMDANNLAYTDPNVAVDVARGIGFEIKKEGGLEGLLSDSKQGNFTKFDLEAFNNSNNLNKEIGKLARSKKDDTGGVTLNLNGSTYEGGGLVVPIASKNFKSTVKDFTSEAVKAFMDEHSDKINTENFKVGFYKFPNENTISVDLNLVVEPKFRDVAIAFGKSAGQKALFDLETFEDVNTGETGANPKEFTTEQVRSIADSLSKGEMPRFSVGEKTPIEVQEFNLDTTAESQKIDLPVDISEIKEVLTELNRLGKDTFLVGGAIRDIFLGQVPKDIDVEVQGMDVDDLFNVLKRYGKATKVDGGNFGIITFTPEGGSKMSEGYDFSVPRTETKVSEGKGGFEIKAGKDVGKKQAFERRENTINAIGYNPITKELYNPFNGLQDLYSKSMNKVSDAFNEDPSRVVRAMQFQARFGLKPSQELYDTMRSMVESGEVDTVPAELWGKNFTKFFTSGVDFTQFFDFLEKTKVGERYFPELMLLKETEQDSKWHPEGNVEEHTKQVMQKAYEIAERDNVEGDDRLVLIMSSLLHDIAKPQTTEVIDGNITARGHEAEGVEPAREFMNKLKIPKSVVERVLPIVKEHLAHASISSLKTVKQKKSAFRKLQNRLQKGEFKGRVQDLLWLMEADMLGRNNSEAQAPEGLFEMYWMKETMGDTKPTKFIQGRDLIEKGLEPSTKFGQIINKAEELQDAQYFETKEDALEWLDAVLKTDNLNIIEVNSKEESSEKELEMPKNYEPKNYGLKRKEIQINPNLTNDGEGNYVFYHYSHQNLDEISPKKSGSNPRNITSRTEQSAMSSAGGLSMYYTKTTNKEANVGNFGHMVKVPYDKVYDISKDENGYEDEAYNRFKEKYPDRAFDGNVSTAWITKIAGENGYDMAVVKWRNSDYRAQSTKVLEPVEKEIIERNVLIAAFTDYETESKPKAKPRFSVGFVQTKERPEGTQITLSNVDDQIQGKGVGTQMYKKAATEAVSKGGTLISDFNNKGAEGVWSKLREQGLTEPTTIDGKVVERIKTTPDSFDSNGEPSVSDVVTYIQSKNYEGQTLSDVEVNEVRNAMLGTTMTSSEELFRALKRAFTPNGIYNPSETSLVASGVYSKVEARRLLESEEAQLAAYEMMHKLKNSDTVLNESELDNNYITVTSSYNSLGTLKKSNPYINKKNATEILGGIKEDTLFYNQSEANDLEFANTKFEELSKLTKLSKTKIEGGRTRTETTLDTLRTRLEETLTLPSDNKLTRNLNYLLEIPNDVWNLEFKNVRTILEDIEASAVDIGLDLSNLNEESYDKTPAEVKSLLNSVRNFVTLQNESTFEILLGEYITFFDVSEAPNVVTLDLNEATTKKTLVYSDTELDSYTLFSEHGLLPLGNNVYQKVNANKTFEQAKEIVYQTLQSGNNIIPKSAFKTEYDITDPKNEVFVKEDITNYVNEEIKKIDNNVNYDADVLRNMVLFSKYFNTQLNNDKSLPSVTGEISLINNYPKNAEYLKTEFIADFNKKMLKEKVKNSEKYNNFYRHFDISSKGIEIVNTDPITMREITPYLTEDLVNHFKLKKEGINLDATNDAVSDVVNDAVLRNYYSNYPKSLPLYKEIYQMDNGTLISNTNKSPFIRVDEGIFEYVETIGNKAVYTKLNENNTDFKTYSTNYITPNLGEISKFNITAGVKANKKINNLYSSAQDTEITNEIDNC